MQVTFYGYPNCSTCKKAKKWLEGHHVDVKYINVSEQAPTEKEIAEWLKKSKLPLKKFFNTSGKVYRELGLKDQLKTANETEMLGFLASDGMLLKRPIVSDGNKVTVGFRENEFEQIWTN